MKNKITIFILLIVSCFTMLFILYACANSNNNENEDSVTIIPSNITFNVNNEYKFKTSDNIDYDSWSVDDSTVLSITKNGLAKAISVGQTTVTVKINETELRCPVKVISAGNSQATDSGIYQIYLNSQTLLTLDSEVKLKASVYKNGILIDKNVDWIIPENDIIEYSVNGNTLNLLSKNKGYIIIKASYEGYETNAIIKVYDNNSILPSPIFSISNGLISWNEVEDAAAYRVSLDNGYTWIFLPQDILQYSIENAVNILNVDVIAVAVAESVNVDSLSYINKSYSFTENEITQAAVNEGDIEKLTENDEIIYKVNLSGDEEIFGKKGFYLYSVENDKNLLNSSDDNLTLYKDTTFKFEVKSDTASKLYFISKAETGEITYSAFDIGAGIWHEAGYKLNAYNEFCVVASENDFYFKNASITKDKTEFQDSTLYQNMIENLQLISASGEINNQIEVAVQEIAANIKFLKKDERILLKARYSNEYNKFADYYETINNDILFYSDMDFGLKDFEIVSNSIRTEINYSYDYIFNNNNGSMAVVSLNSGATTIDANITYSIPTDKIYNYYIFNIYSFSSYPILIGNNEEIRLSKGWNNIILSYERLIESNRIYIPVIANTNGQTLFYFGAVKCLSSIDINFIDNQFDLDKVSVSGRALLTYNVSDYEYITDNDNASIKVISTNITPNMQDINIDYSMLLSETEPFYDYYSCNIYTTSNRSIIFGSKTISLVQGWNEINLLYEEIIAVKKIYLGAPANTAGEVLLYISSLTGYANPDINFADNNFDISRLTLSGRVAVNYNYNTDYIAEGDNVSIAVVSTNITPGVQDSNIDYTELVSNLTESSYSYYTCDIYATANKSILFGDKAISLVQGWNTVTLTYTELTANTRIYTGMFANTNGFVIMYIGSLKGVI